MGYIFILSLLCHGVLPEVTGYFMYNFTLTLGENFKQTKGFVHVILRNDQGGEVYNVSVPPRAIPLVPNTTMSNLIAIAVPVSTFCKVEFQWLATPDSKLGHKIKVEGLTIIPYYLPEPNKTTLTKKYCCSDMVEEKSPAPMFVC